MQLNSAVVLWSRRDLRRRWLALVLIGVLAGLTAGVAVAAFDGARRSATAFERLRRATNASDAVVFPSQANVLDPDWTALRARPEVRNLGVWALAFGRVDGVEGDNLIAPVGDTWLQTLDRPLVVAGRMFAPDNPYEVVVSDVVAQAEGVHVGDHFPFVPYTPDQAFGEPSRGPTLDMTVVGIIRSPLTNTFTGAVFPSPAFVQQYTGRAMLIQNAVVQLRDGEADMAALRRDAGQDLAPGTPVLDLHTTARRVTATTDVEHAMLVLLAAIVALAGSVLVGQALVRSSVAIAGDEPALRALGMTRGQLVGAAVLPHVVSGVLALVVTAATAAVASRWFPVGLAATVDPDRGTRFNAALFPLTALAVGAIVVVAAAASTWIAVRPRLGGPTERASWLARLGLRRPLPVTVGARLALGHGGRANRATSWPAIVGAAAALAGVVALVTLDTGLVQSQHHAEVAGVAWDADVLRHDGAYDATGTPPELLDAIRADGTVAVSTVVRATIEVGEVGVPTFAVQTDGREPSVRLVTLNGRRPEAPGEVELGPATARDLGVGIGDDVTLAAGRQLHVVGLGLFPADVHAQFDEGAWVMPDDWPGLAQEQIAAGAAGQVVGVRFTDRHDVDAQIDALRQRLGDQVDSVTPVAQPDELVNLHHVRSLPALLAAFLAAVGLVAVAYSLFSSVRRRRRDFAVMSALGVTRRDARLVVVAQAIVVVVVGVLIGVPVGLLAGRSGWRAIADRVPLVFRSPLEPSTVVVVVPVAVLAALVLALLPARRAARIRAAAVLRAE